MTTINTTPLPANSQTAAIFEEKTQTNNNCRHLGLDTNTHNTITTETTKVEETTSLSTSVIHSITVNTTMKLQLFEYCVQLLGIGLMLLCLIVIATKLNKRLKLINKFSNLITMFKIASVSVYEVIALTTIFATVIVFDSISAAVEEDVLDSAASIILLFCISVIFLSIFSLGATLVFTLTPKCAGDYLLTFAIYDIINFLLCLLRILMCWSRYIFYDLQLESIDMALHYTDEVENWLQTPNMTNNTNIWLLILEVQLDLVFVAVQTLLSLFKLVIAAYLTFLVADLFIIRPISLSITLWVMIVKHRNQ